MSGEPSQICPNNSPKQCKTELPSGLSSRAYQIGSHSQGTPGKPSGLGTRDLLPWGSSNAFTTVPVRATQPHRKGTFESKGAAYIAAIACVPLPCLWAKHLCLSESPGDSWLRQWKRCGCCAGSPCFLQRCLGSRNKAARRHETP